MVEVIRRPDPMWIMNLVWPITGLYMGPLALLTCYTFGSPAHEGKRTFWQGVFVGATHCGAGCTLGDIIAETAIFLGGGAAFWVVLASDYVAAYLFGIAFQYFSIAPMRGGGRATLVAAIKADTLSLTAFQIGLFAWMAWMNATFPMKADDPAYWFMMQIGMCIGFVTSYPMNWWLIRRGIKTEM